jgi:WD40 repeat protein
MPVPDRPMLAVCADDGMHLWDVRDPSAPTSLLLLPPHVTEKTANCALSPDGRVLATVGRSTNTVLLWDVSDPRRPVQRAALANADPPGDIALAPGGRLMAVSGASLTLWDFSDPGHPHRKGQPLPQSGYMTPVFGPDGRTVVTAGVAGTLQFWDLDVSHAVDRICATTAGALTPEVWQRHFPSIPFQAACR